MVILSRVFEALSLSFILTAAQCIHVWAVICARYSGKYTAARTKNVSLKYLCHISFILPVKKKDPELFWFSTHFTPVKSIEPPATTTSSPNPSTESRATDGKGLKQTHPSAKTIHSHKFTLNSWKH